jgi:hypothetical protein
VVVSKRRTYRTGIRLPDGYVIDSEADLGVGGEVAIEDGGTPVIAEVATLNFGDNLAVTDDGGGTVTIDASGGGGGGGASYAETVGDGVDDTFTITHSLDTSDVVVVAWEVSTGEQLAVAVTVLDADSVRVVFTDAPGTDDARVVVLASGGSGGGGGGGTTLSLLHVRDEKTAGTNGGAFTSGDWRTRDLNAVLTNEITGASLDSNQVTLPAGTYYIEAEAPSSVATEGGPVSKARLRDITNSVTLLVGTTYRQNANATGAGSATESRIRGYFTLADTATIELQHRTTVTHVYGVASDFGEVEVYSDLRAWRLEASGGGGGGGGGGGTTWLDPVASGNGPAGTHDDEFDDDTLDAAWTLVEAASPNVTLTEARDVLSVHHPGGDASNQWHGIMRSIGGMSAPVTIETAVRIGGPAQSYNMMGIGFADGVTVGAGAQIINVIDLRSMGTGSKTNLRRFTRLQHVRVPAVRHGLASVLRWLGVPPHPVGISQHVQCVGVP